MYRATEKHKWVRAVKSKPKVLRHFKVDPVLKIDETVYKQAESKWYTSSSIFRYSSPAGDIFLLHLPEDRKLRPIFGRRVVIIWKY